MRRVIILIAVAVMAVGCGQGRATKQTKQPTAVNASKPKEFPAVTIPSYISEQQEALEYLTEHYWDKFDFSDTTYIDVPEVTEQGFANYIGYLQMLPPDSGIAEKSLRDMFGKARPHAAMYDHLWSLADSYLDDPNSPLRNEDLYIVVLEEVISNPNVDELLKLAPQHKLEMALKNRVGSRANDFAYTTANGKKGSLYSVKADYLILYFYNLGCNACRETREEMMYVLSQPPLDQMMRDGKIKVLAIYPDEDMTEWDNYVGDIPKEWINGYDPAQMIRDKGLYELRAIPSLYLLDKNKNVMLKDFVSPTDIYYSIVE